MITESEAKGIIKELEELRFTSLKIGYFDPTARFSQVSFTIDDTNHVVLGKSLFCIETAALMGQGAEFPGKEALDKFLTVLPTLNATELSLSQASTESRTFFNIAEHLLTKLSEKVVLSHDDYSSLLNEDPSYVPPNQELSSATPCTRLSVGLTGMGELNTWHGTPDARVRAYQSTETIVLRGESSNVSPVHSLGDNVAIEAKRDPDCINKHQLIATTVISSFIERNLHRDANPMVPVILITTPTTMVCLYDCTKDLLLMSEELKWIDVGNNTFYITNLFVIWLFIHHRFVAAIVWLVSSMYVIL